MGMTVIDHKLFSGAIREDFERPEYLVNLASDGPSLRMEIETDPAGS